MRLAVLADIHGNADALRAVLHDARAQGAEGLIVNGDVVNRGPDSVAALEVLMNLPAAFPLGVRFTLGNHDDLVRLWQARSNLLPAGWFSDPFWGATAWSAEQLERAGVLHTPADWPMSLTLSAPGLTDVLVAHGTPHEYREGISERTALERVAELSEGGRYGVLIGSHIHRQADAVFELPGGQSVHVLNTGAVGAPADGDPRAGYLLLTATLQGWQTELRRVPYDRAGILRRFETSGLLGMGLSAQIFRDEIVTARSLYTPFWSWTEAEQLPRTAVTWAAFLRQHPAQSGYPVLPKT
ncbi:metallophosphoesterase family protein [Deinococcus oregonensis]|uniref:Metallophosphoesterase family protein n=1 Tax=Deinococcus oregonensis TaxID=1805970 RepID=A0ABV6B3M9_9DEIO